MYQNLLMSRLCHFHYLNGLSTSLSKVPRKCLCVLVGKSVNKDHYLKYLINMDYLIGNCLFLLKMIF